MSQFLRVTMLLGSVTMINLLVQIVRTKVVALSVGQAGMAVLAQMADWQGLLAAYVLLGTEQGLVALSAEAWAQGNRPAIDRLLRLIRTKVAPPVVLGLVALAAASPWLMPEVTGHPGTVVAGAVGTLAMLLQLWVRPRQSILNGAKAFGLVARSRIIESVTATAMVLPLVLAFGLSGALWSLAVVQVSAFVATAWVWRSFALPPPQSELVAAGADADSEDWKTIRRFAGGLLISTGMASLLGLILRKRVIVLLGLDQAGMYQVAYALTMQYLGIVLGAMSAYSFPTYRVAAQQPGQLAIEVNQTFRSVLLLVTPVIVGVLTLRDFLIWALFSRDYLGSADLLQIQLVGDLFKVVAWAMGLTILAAGRIRLHVLLELILGLTWLASVEVASRWFGRIGPSVGFLVNQVLMCIVYAAVNYRVFGLTVWRANLGLLAASGALVIGVAVLPHGNVVWRIAAAVGGVSLWAAVSVRKAEYHSARNWLLGRIQTVLSRLRAR